MKRKVICSILIVLLVFVLTLTTKTIKAWLQDSKTTDEISFTLGKVEYLWEGSVNDGFVVPGENIITTPYKLSNLSTITTELRLKINIESSAFDATNMFENISLNDNWVVNDDGYYYYQNNDNQIITPEISSIIVLESLVLDGNIVNNDFSGTEINLNLIFEAKQADYVTWEELGNTSIRINND